MKIAIIGNFKKCQGKSLYALFLEYNVRESLFYIRDKTAIKKIIEQIDRLGSLIN